MNQAADRLLAMAWVGAGVLVLILAFTVVAFGLGLWAIIVASDNRNRLDSAMVRPTPRLIASKGPTVETRTNIPSRPRSRTSTGVIAASSSDAP